MRILGIDPSFTCTGWCMIDTYQGKIIGTGEIKSDVRKSHVARIHEIIHGLTIVKWQHGSPTHVYIEGEAFAAKGRVVHLAELCGAIKEHFHYTRLLTFSPSQARKLWFGKGKIPYDKQKQPKEYCQWIRDHSSHWLTYEVTSGPDVLDASVIALAALKELTDSTHYEDIVMMRLHDEKVLTKHKGVYTLGSGKKKKTFKKLSKLDEETQKELLTKYRGILEGTQLYNTQNGPTISEY